MLETLQGLDGGLLLAIQGLRQDWLDPLAAGFTTLGNAGVLWIVLSALMLCWRPTRKRGCWPCWPCCWGWCAPT